MGIAIRYMGHSCFTLECRGYRICIDPYGDFVPGYGRLELEADAVYCSHAHDDHCFTAAVSLRDGGAGVSPFKVSEIQSFHDAEGGRRRGLNTVRIFEAEGLRIAHLGDIGCAPSSEGMEMLRDLDACMVPVGGFYTVDAAEAKALMDELAPRRIIPMHFRLGKYGFAEIGELSSFTELYGGVSFAGGDSFFLDEGSPEGVIVLEYGG